MIRIGVFSDSHGDTHALDVLLRKMGNIDAACFLGDISRDAMHLQDRLSAMPHAPAFYAVRGNNDFASMLPDSRIVEIGGKRIYMTHGHLCVNALSLAYRALENGADVAMFGHTHNPLCEMVQGVLLLNPGSAGNTCRGGPARASILTIDGDRMRVSDVEMYDRP